MCSGEATLNRMCFNCHGICRVWPGEVRPYIEQSEGFIFICLMCVSKIATAADEASTGREAALVTGSKFSQTPFSISGILAGPTPVVFSGVTWKVFKPLGVH